jgi:hypothetical protein
VLCSSEDFAFSLELFQYTLSLQLLSRVIRLGLLRNKSAVALIAKASELHWKR